MSVTGSVLCRCSCSDYEVRLRLLLPRGSWRRLSQAGVTEVLLEELMVRPLMALSSLSPSAELYHLKRRLMDSPFNREWHHWHTSKHSFKDGCTLTQLDQFFLLLLYRHLFT